MRSIILLPIFFIAFLSATAFFYLCYLPQCAEITKLKASVTEKKDALYRVQNFMNDKDGAAHSAAIAQRGASANKKVPKHMGQSSFIAFLEREAQHEHLVLAAVVPGQPEEINGAFCLPLTIELYGSYFPLLSFLKSLENSERFIRMDSAEIESDDGKLHVKLRLSIFSEKI